MHAIAALEQGGERSIREMVLHLEQVNQLGHLSALLNDLIKIVSRVVSEFLNCFLIGKHAVLLVDSVLVHTQIGLTRHKQTIFHNINETETQEVKWNMHEVGCRIGHQPQNVFAHDI